MDLNIIIFLSKRRRRIEVYSSSRNPYKRHYTFLFKISNRRKNYGILPFCLFASRIKENCLIKSGKKPSCFFLLPRASFYVIKPWLIVFWSKFIKIHNISASLRKSSLIFGSMKRFQTLIINNSILAISIFVWNTHKYLTHFLCISLI